MLVGFQDNVACGTDGNTYSNKAWISLANCVSDVKPLRIGQCQ